MKRGLTAALELFGVEPHGLRRIPTGRQNEHWRVVTGDGLLVLRRYSALRSSPAIAIEHAALRHVAELGWPVAPPIACADGTTVVALEGLRYSLFRFLSGRVAEAGNRRIGRMKGRLLARLHRDLARFPMEGQRDGFGRAWELDLFGPTEEYPTFNALLAGFEREHRDLARAVRSVRYRNLRELSRLGYGDLAVQP
ncbi:MAG: phosphotransferase, partial [Dehalococcoidia bacterium]